jgi:quercetin dioxygenase-like cupin family protein
MQIRRFSADLKTKVPGGHPGLYAVPIQQDSRQVPIEKLKVYAQRVNGLPLLLDVPVMIVAMYFEPHAILEEHSTDTPLVFLVIGGQGTVRIGGPQGETRHVNVGDAVLWPANIDHMVWTSEEPLQAIAIHTPQERATSE